MNWLYWIIPVLIALPVACAEEVRMATYFPDFVDDPSGIRWSHAVNTRDALKLAIEGDVEMIEADVSLGTVSGGRGKEGAVMAHPPLTDLVDVDLRDWLGELISLKKKLIDGGRQRRFGIKLDFKSFDIVLSAFQIVTDFFDEIDFPMWFNADILAGPVNATQKPVSSFIFLHMCNAYFPESIASIGWTTALNMDANSETTLKAHHRYEWDHVVSMAALLHKVNTSQTRTFPVRASFVARSIDCLKWLLGVVPDSTLTVWSNVLDDDQVDDLILLRNSLPKSKVYYDLPKRLDDEFRKARKTSDNPDVISLRKINDNDDRHRTIINECILQSSLTLAFIKPCNNTVDITNWSTSSNRLIRGTLEFLKAPEGRLSIDDYDDGQSIVFGIGGHQMLVERSGLVHEVLASNIVNTTKLARSRCYSFQMDVGRSPATAPGLHVNLWSADCVNVQSYCKPIDNDGMFFAVLGADENTAGASIGTGSFGGSIQLLLGVESRGDSYKVIRGFQGIQCNDQSDKLLNSAESTANSTRFDGAAFVAVLYVLMLGPLLFINYNNR